MKTAIYLRISSRGQAFESQEPDLARWVKAQEASLKITYYRDQYTGKSMDRPGFQEMAAAIAAGKVGQVVVWRIDRLGRTAKGLTAFFADLVERRVNLISLKDGLDLATPGGRLMANMLASVAAYETEIRAERITAGLEVAKAKGVKFGRPAGKTKAITLTDEKRQAVLSLRAQGNGIAGIARVTQMSRTSVYLILRDQQLVGNGRP